MKPRLIIHEFLKNARKIYQNFYICKNQSQTTAYHPKYHLKLQATLFVCLVVLFDDFAHSNVQSHLVCLFWLVYHASAFSHVGMTACMSGFSSLALQAKTEPVCMALFAPLWSTTTALASLAISSPAHTSHGLIFISK